MLRTLFKSHSREFQFLFFINAFGISLVIFRFILTREPSYFFLWWNVFLAAIPYGITLLLGSSDMAKNGVVFWGSFLLWMLFLPNAPYICTDIMHLGHTPYRYLWFDMLMLLTYASAGLAFGLYSLRAMAILIRERAGELMSRIMVSIALFAAGFGVYLGRFQRYNSWDLIHHPNRLLLDVADRILNPFAHPRTWMVTVLTGVFLHILYFGLFRKSNS